MKQLALCIVFSGAAFTFGAAAQSSDEHYFSDMRWRLVGPHRAGRIWCVAGVPGDPSVYYAGTPAGALWKTTSGGTTWRSVSDDLPVTGIGAVAVAPSNPDVVYAGTGSNTLGNGVYRSDDAGATWRHAGLADTKYITALLDRSARSRHRNRRRRFGRQFRLDGLLQQQSLCHARGVSQHGWWT